MSSSGVTHFDVIKICEAQTDSDVAETRVNLEAIDKKYEHVLSKILNSVWSLLSIFLYKVVISYYVPKFVMSMALSSLFNG